MKKIKILHLLNSYGDSSISRIVLRIVQGLGSDEYNWHVCGLSNQGSMYDTFQQIGVKLFDLDPKNSFSWKQLHQILITEGIEVIHTHTPRTILVASLAAIGIESTTQIATKHLLTKPSDRRFGFAVTILDYLTLYFPDSLVAVSQSMYNQIIDLPGIRHERVNVVNNSIPCKYFYAPEQREACRKELGIDEKTILIGYTGRLDKVKRTDLLLQAFSNVHQRFPHSKLILIGTGELETSLHAYASQLEISSHVIFAGFRTDIARLLAAIDVYISSSTNEGLSLSILEAMAAGKCVIATDVGGTSEVVHDGMTGILIPPLSATALSSAITLVVNDNDLRSRLATVGCRFVFDNHDLPQMVRAYGDLYKKMVHEPSGEALWIKSSMS